MRETMKLEIRRSEIAQEMAEISRAAELTPELRAKADALAAEHADLEVRFRAAAIAEEEAAEVRSRQAVGDPSVPADRELAEVRSRSSLAAYASAAAKGVAPVGAEAELREALIPGADPHRVPMTMLAERPEVRAVGDQADPTMMNWYRPPGVFRFPLLSRLGINARMVPTGRHLYQAFYNAPSVTRSAPDGTTSAADSTVNAAAMTFVPTRLTTRVDFQVGEGHQTPGLEEEIRAMLSRSLSDAVELDAIVGGTWNTQQTTFTRSSVITGPDLFQHASGEDGSDAPSLAAVPSDTVTYKDMIGQAAVLVDGYYSETASDITIIGSVGAYRHAYSEIQTNGDELAGSILNANSGGFLASDFIPSKATSGTTRNETENLLAVRSGISMQAFLPVWDSFELIRDPYSNAASGGIRLLGTMFWDFGVANIAGNKALKSAAGNSGVAALLAWKTE